MFVDVDSGIIICYGKSVFYIDLDVVLDNDHVLVMYL